MKKTISFFVLFIMTICSVIYAQDSVTDNTELENQFYDAIKFYLYNKGVNSGMAYYFVGMPCLENKTGYIFLPLSQFQGNSSGVEKIADRDILSLTMLLCVYYQDSNKLLSIQVTLSEIMEKKIKAAMKEDRVIRIDKIGKESNNIAYESVDTYSFFVNEKTYKDPYKLKAGFLSPLDKNLKKFLDEITQWIKARGLPKDDCVKIFIYGDNLENYRITYFMKDNPDGWIGCKNQACKCYCKNPDINNFEKNLPAAECINDYSLIAIISNRIAYIEKDANQQDAAVKLKFGIQFDGTKKWHKNEIEQYYKDYPWFLKDYSVVNLLKEIAISLVDSEYWTEVFRQNPIVPYKIYAK